MKVYLETSFFSICANTRETAKMRVWKQTSIQWWQTQRNSFELFVSQEVLRELLSPNFGGRDQAISMVTELDVLEPSPEVDEFAALLVSQNVMPGPSNEGDALHVAYAAVYGIDYIISWNVGHLANPNKRTHLGVICARADLRAPKIVTPDLLWIE